MTEQKPQIYIIPSWFPSALEPDSGTFFRDRAGILTRAGWDITIVTSLVHSIRDIFRWPRLSNPLHPDHTPFGTIYRREALNPFPGMTRLFFLFYKWRLLSLFRKALDEQGEPDLVYIHSSLWAGASLAEECYNRQIPYIVSEHLKEFLLPPGWTGFQRKMVERSYQYAAQIIATSTALKQAIRDQYPETHGKITVIPNPADIQHFPLRSESPGKTEPFTFITVALFRPEKRLDLLLRAFRNIVTGISSDKTKPQLILVGDGPLKTRLKNLAKELQIADHVHFAGYKAKESLVPLLHRSHVFCFTSEVETFGVAPIEAMATGLPVIATRCGGPEDTVQDHTGILIPVNNVEALVASMETMMDRYDRYHPQEIRAYVEKEYGDDAYIRRLKSVVDDVGI